MREVEAKSAPPPVPRTPLERRIESLCRDHASRLSVEVLQAAEYSLQESKLAAADSLVKSLDDVVASVRRIRAADRPAAALSELVGAATATCNRAVLLLCADRRLIPFRPQEDGGAGESSGDGQFALDRAAAPAIAEAIAGRVPRSTSGSAERISERVAAELACRDEDEIRLYPVVLRETVIGVLLAEGIPAQFSAIETLVLAAEAWIEALQLRQDRSRNGGTALA